MGRADYSLQIQFIERGYLEWLPIAAQTFLLYQKGGERGLRLVISDLNAR